jgi:hypothetical protein
MSLKSFGFRTSPSKSTYFSGSSRSSPSSSPLSLSSSSFLPVVAASSVAAVKKRSGKEKGKRRKSTNPTYMPELRVFRRDIRRRYGEMWVNVNNYHDPSLLDAWFREFCRPDCQFYTFKPSPQTSSDRETLVAYEKLGKKEEAILGLNDIISAFIMNFELMPDSVARLKECQVRVIQGSSGSRIVGKIIIRGTKLLHVVQIEKENNSNPNVNPKTEASFAEDLEGDMMEVEGTERTVRSSSQDSISSSTTSEGSFLSSELSEVDDDVLSPEKLDVAIKEEKDEAQDICPMTAPSMAGIQLVPLEKPIEMVMEAVFTMTLDESNRIYKFQLNCSSLSLN